jgi:hypothetical protein
MNKRFIELLKKSSGGMPTEDQQSARKEFALVVADSCLRLWSPNMPILDKGCRLLIGVAASYSINDLELLDALNDKLETKLRINDTVDVFDVSDCESQDAFDKYIQGISPVYQTPVIGLWEDGNLTIKMWGADARNWLIERYLDC